MKNIISKEEHMKWLDEEERWSPINSYLDIEDCYEVSSYGRIRNTKYNKILDDIHHSTNGFDYIFIATKEHKPSYQHIDVIVCMTFWAWNVNNLPVHEPIIPSHIDGDTRNNRASNLEFILDKEIWKPIVGYKDIIDGMYEISNHGNVRNVAKRFRCQINLNPLYYPKCGFMTPNGKKAYDVHRIIAKMFTIGYDSNHNVVNHIDNTRINNHWRNIEWCTWGWNVEHGQAFSPQTDIDVIDYLRLLLLKYKNPLKAYNALDKSKYPDIDYEMIRHYKHDSDWPRRSWMFTQVELESLREDARVRGHFDESDIRHFCELLVEYNGDITTVWKILKEEGYFINQNTIVCIKTKKNYPKISDEYFTKDTFKDAP